MKMPYCSLHLQASPPCSSEPCSEAAEVRKEIAQLGKNTQIKGFSCNAPHSRLHWLLELHDCAWGATITPWLRLELLKE